MTKSDSLNAYQLSSLAECGTPDSVSSPGAYWLKRIASAIGDYDWDVSENDRSDLVHEVADGIVPIYTHEIWAIFVDLAAYREDVSELIDPSAPLDFEQAAKVALYIIAERLVSALIEALAEADDDEG